MAKNDHFHEGGKVGRSNANPIKLFSVDYYDLKSMSFKFGNDIIFIFEMRRSPFLMSVGKMNISLLFRPSASEVLDQTNKWPYINLSLSTIYQRTVNNIFDFLTASVGSMYLLSVSEKVE